MLICTVRMLCYDEFLCFSLVWWITHSRGETVSLSFSRSFSPSLSLSELSSSNCCTYLCHSNTPRFSNLKIHTSLLCLSSPVLIILSNSEISAWLMTDLSAWEVARLAEMFGGWNNRVFWGGRRGGNYLWYILSFSPIELLVSELKSFVMCMLCCYCREILFSDGKLMWSAAFEAAVLGPLKLHLPQKPLPV